MATRDAVSQARARGGKPRDANRIAGRTAAQEVYEGQRDSAQANDGSTVVRAPDGAIYRYVPKFDYTTIERNGRTSQPMRGNQLPGGMNAYIDEVLGMADMPNPSSGGDANVPVPAPRPTADAQQSTKMMGPADQMDRTAQQTVEGADVVAEGDEGMSFMDGLLGALGLTGAVYAGKKAYDAVRNRTPIDESIDAIDGNAAPTAQDTKAGLPATQQSRDLVPVRESGLPAVVPSPAQASSNVDQMINAIDGPDPQAAIAPPPKQLTDADAPYSPRNPEQPPPTQGVNRTQIIQQLEQFDNPGDAARFLRENGIDASNITREEMAAIAEISNRMKGARAAAADAVTSGVRAATRGAVR